MSHKILCVALNSCIQNNENSLWTTKLIKLMSYNLLIASSLKIIIVQIGTASGNERKQQSHLKNLY